MRQRNIYGFAGTRTFKPSQQPGSGPRRPVTARGRMVLASSRRRISPRQG
jgi:hypothetical protein